MGQLQGLMMVAGEAEGEAIFSNEPLSFWGGYNQETGEIIDRRHPLSGQNACDKVLVIPCSRGSTTTVAVLMEAVLAGKSPAAILVNQLDPYFTLAAVVAKEVFNKVIPIILLSVSDFDQLRGVKWVKINRNGSICI